MPIPMSGWLIEREVDGQPMWWGGDGSDVAMPEAGRRDPYGFTTDANQAIRFARKEDGERVLVELSACYNTEFGNYWTGCTVTEHVFG